MVPPPRRQRRGAGVSETLRHTQGCVILVWSGCSTVIGFVVGMAAVIVWQAW